MRWGIRPAAAWAVVLWACGPVHAADPVRAAATMSDCKPPVFPASALKAGESGRTTVRALVGRDGSPRVKVIASSGSARLDQASIEAMASCRFTPPRDPQGRPVESVVDRTYQWVAAAPAGP